MHELVENQIFVLLNLFDSSLHGRITDLPQSTYLVDGCLQPHPVMTNKVRSRRSSLLGLLGSSQAVQSTDQVRANKSSPNLHLLPTPKDESPRIHKRLPSIEIHSTRETSSLTQIPLLPAGSVPQDQAECNGTPTGSPHGMGLIPMQSRPSSVLLAGSDDLPPPPPFFHQDRQSDRSSSAGSQSGSKSMSRTRGRSTSKSGLERETSRDGSPTAEAGVPMNLDVRPKRRSIFLQKSQKPLENAPNSSAGSQYPYWIMKPETREMYDVCPLIHWSAGELDEKPPQKVSYLILTESGSRTLE